MLNSGKGLATKGSASISESGGISRQPETKSPSFLGGGRAVILAAQRLLLLLVDECCGCLLAAGICCMRGECAGLAVGRQDYRTGGGRFATLLIRQIVVIW